jgi:hypothetical protein
MGLMRSLWRESDMVKGNMGIHMGLAFVVLVVEEEEEGVMGEALQVFW